MNRLYNVEAVNFEGDTMRLRVDGADYRVSLREVSQRLADATAAQRLKYEVSPSGYGIHWPDIDEDLSIPGLLRVAAASAA
jgi:hypothetical protein